MHDRESVENLMESGDFEAAKTRIKTRIQGIVNHYEGEIDEWDFNNELWNFDKYRKEFDGQNYFKNNAHGPSGDSILALFEQWAREANPNIRLFHNDYNIITQSTTSNAIKYRDLIKDLRDNHGVDIDGIGVQGHFGNYRTKQHITDCFNILDDLGLPIKVTEFDAGNDSMSDAQRANLLENLYRASFEHESVEGVIMWGFWSGCHWRRAKAPWQYIGYERNDYNLGNDEPLQWVETPQVNRYQDLVFGEWWTDADLVADDNGNIELSAFAGDYEIIIDGVSFNKSIPTNEDGDTLYFLSTDEGLVESVGEFKITKPLPDSIFAINSPIEINASYQDGTVSDVSSVEFYLNGDLHKLDSVAPFETTIYEAHEGDHILSIVAYGNSSYQNAIQVSVSSTSDGGPNLLGNSGFETNNLDSQLGSFGSSLIISNDYSATGSQSLLVERSDSGSWRGVKYELDNLEEGQTYVFSAKVYLEQSSGKISLTTKKASTNNYTWPAEITNPQTETWLELTGQITYDSSLMDFIYIAGVDEYEDFYVDDISISKVGGALVNPEDTDGDGMLDSWEQQFLVPLGLTDITELLPNEDSDGDGSTNVEEYRSDTLPFNPYLSFRITDYSHDASNFQCEWRGSPSKDYRILSTTDIVSGEWSVVEEAIPGSLTYTNSWSDADQVSSNKFYKVEIDD